MQKIILVSFLLLICYAGRAQKKWKEGFYIVPDSIKANGIYTDVVVNKKSNTRKISAYLNVGETTLSLQMKKGKKQANFGAFKFGSALVTPPNVIQKGLQFTWEHDWKYNEKYGFLVLVAIDSAKSNSIYSGYIFLPAENKWKLIGTLASLYSSGVTGFFALNKNKKDYSCHFSNRWLLRRNNTWKALDSH